MKMNEMEGEQMKAGVVIDAEEELIAQEKSNNPTFMKTIWREIKT